MRAARGLHRLVEALPRPPASAGAPFLGSWRLAGPFTATEDPGPEALLGRDEAWRDFDERVVNRAYDDFNDVRLWLRREAGHAPPDGAFVYLHVWLHCAAPVRAELRAGATGPVRITLDGAPVLAADGWTLRRDARRAPLALAAGWHRLVVRLQDAGGPSGFYVRVTDRRGDRVRGLTPALGGPGELGIATWALPRGFAGWPYVELDNRRGEPRAAPFELLGRGGQPPYRWTLQSGARPAGLELSETTGALTGTPEIAGRRELLVRVQDAAGARAERRLELAVEDPPTRWYEDAKLGVSVHFDKPDSVPVESWDRELAASPGYAECWAVPAAKAGAGVLVLTAKHHDSWANWPTEVRRSDGVAAQRTGTDTLAAAREAALAHGMRFGVYFSTLDTWHPGYRDDRPDFLRFQYRQLEEVVERYRPSLVWLDGHWDAPRRDWGYDALFSLVHGHVDEAVIANNPGRRTFNVGDAGYGDVDVRTFEGHGYWDHMPRPQRRRRNPRPLPAEKYAFTCNWWSPGLEPRWVGCERNASWGEWVRVLSRVVAEGGTLLLGLGPGFPGAPAEAPPVGELHPGARDVLTGMGAWLWPDRAEAFVGVRPGPVAAGRWGRCVQRDGYLYLHLPPGRAAGWPARRLKVAPVPRLSGAHLLPDRRPVPFAQDGAAVTLELSAVPADPVLGLVALQLAPDR